MVQQSTIIFTVGLFLTLIAGFYKFGYNITPAPVTTIPSVVLPATPPSSPTSSSLTGSSSDGGAGDGGTDSDAQQQPLEDPENPGKTLPPIVPGAVEPHFEGCIDVAHEETANQVVLMRRMVAFRPDFTKWKRVWGDRLVLPGSVSANSNHNNPQPHQQKDHGSNNNNNNNNKNSYSKNPNHDPAPIMNQWLYCYTSNYSEDPNLPENNDCTAELAGLDEPVRGGKYFIGAGLDTCTVSPVFQGNITSWSALSPIVKQFPGPLADSDRSLEALSKSRSWLWKNMPDPFSFSCPTCGETRDLTHPSLLVGTRRWYMVRRWAVMTPAADTSGGDFEVKAGNNPCMVFLENSIRTSMDLGERTRCSGLSEPSPGDYKSWSTDLPLSQIVDVAFALLPGDFAFFAFTVVDKTTRKPQTFLMTPQMGHYGVGQIWVTMQMLYGFDDIAAAAVGSDGDDSGGDNSNNNKGGTKRRRALFSKSRPVFPRNITDEILSAKCFPHELIYRSRQRNMHTCWMDVIGVLGGKGRAKVRGAAALVATERFSYLPCHPPYMTALVADARKKDNMDQHGLYWPFSCNKIAHRRPCIEDKINSVLRLTSHGSKPQINLKRNVKMRELVRPKVAVCLAGFLRSFHLTAFAIFQNIVDPFDADFFGATWNVQGRAKKTLPVLKGHVINVDRMKRRVYNLIPKGRRNVTDLILKGRYAIEVFSYRMYEQSLLDWKKAGMRHAGLYMLLQAAIGLAVNRADLTKEPYDVVIRSRWDLVPLVPLQILPVWAEPDRQRRSYFSTAQTSSTFEPGSFSTSRDGGGGNNNNNNNNGAAGTSSSSRSAALWMVDTGSACEMDGFWWPRTAILREGVVVAHTADTRYKLFSWQYCDWVHIGTFETMIKMSMLYDWALRNYVDSGAQFIEHVYAIDQGLRFYPMQLYLKILRETIKKPKPPRKGKPMKIRRHLFG